MTIACRRSGVLHPTVFALLDHLACLHQGREAAVQGLSLEISETVMLPLYQGKTDAAAALGQVADLLADAGTSD